MREKYTQRTHNGRLPISSFGTRAGNWRKKREKFFRINAPKKKLQFHSVKIFEIKGNEQLREMER